MNYIKVQFVRGFLLLFLMLTVSFINDNIYNSKKTTNTKLKQFHTRFIFYDSIKIAYFECEDFTSEALNFYTITTMALNYSNRLKLEKKSITNWHNTAIIDTIYTYSNKGNLIQIYKAKQNELIFTFNVTDSLLNLNGGVNTGMSMDDFSQKFSISKRLYTKVQISNSDGSLCFMFYFKNNKLNQIISNLYID